METMNQNDKVTSTKEEPNYRRVKAMPFVIGTETFEKLGTIGTSSNLLVYLTTVFNMMKSITATNVINVFNGTCNFGTLIGAFLCDTYFGRYKTLGFASISSFLGMLLLTLTAASDLSFDVGSSPTKDMYSTLLISIRDNVKDPNLKYGGTDIPVMAAESPKTTKFLLVDLKASEGGTITIGISKEDKSSLYVQGYLDKIKINNKEIFRAHIFPDASPNAIKNMFPEAPLGVNRVQMKYTSGYGDIQKKAGLSSRSKLGLGVPQLNRFINKVYGKPLDVETEAQLMLIVIQMLSEATRFNYIEKMILKNFDSFGYKPDPKTLKLEENWQTITKKIKSSKNGVISPVLVLTDDSNKPWIVSKVSEIAPDMGLLKYEGKEALTRNTTLS